MIKHSIPALNSLKISDLNRLLPENVYVQSIEISYIRTHERDEYLDLPINTFKVRQCAKTVYIPRQTIEFSTPLFTNTSRPVQWQDFSDDMQMFFELAFQYDPNVEQRTYVGDVALLEIPHDYISGNKWDHSPLNEEDPLYDGVWCKFGYFLRTHRLLGGKGLGDMLAGCIIPADLSMIELVKTKRANGNLIRNGGIIRCFHDNKKMKHVIDEKEISKNTSEEWVQATFPTLYNKNILSIRECEGSWEINKSFRAEACNKLSANITGGLDSPSLIS
jgi:hypothetical protein